MLTEAPFSVLLLGLLGMAIVLASVARIVVIEHQARRPLVPEPEHLERTPIRL